MDSLHGRPYKSFQRAGNTEGSMRTYLRSQYLGTLTDPAVETVVEFARAAPSPGATVFVSPWIGAEIDPPADATASPHRDPAHHLPVEARLSDPARDDEHEAWVRAFHEALRPHTTGDEGEKRLRAAYGDNYDRLVPVNNEWDPDSLFSVNQNVEPGAAGESSVGQTTVRPRSRGRGVTRTATVRTGRPDGPTPRRASGRREPRRRPRRT